MATEGSSGGIGAFPDTPESSIPQPTHPPPLPPMRESTPALMPAQKLYQKRLRFINESWELSI